MALCSLSMGKIVAPHSLAFAIKSSPDITSASLFANNTRFPALTAANVGMSPAAPTIAAMTVSTLLSLDTFTNASTPK